MENKNYYFIIYQITYKLQKKIMEARLKFKKKTNVKKAHGIQNIILIIQKTSKIESFLDLKDILVKKKLKNVLLPNLLSRKQTKKLLTAFHFLKIIK